MYVILVIYDISAANFEKVFKIVGFPYPITTMDYWSATHNYGNSMLIYLCTAHSLTRAS